MKYKLSEQAQLSVVALFQKALVTMTDVSEILKNLKFAFDDEGQLCVLNPETCNVTEDELKEAASIFEDAEVSNTATL